MRMTRRPDTADAGGDEQAARRRLLAAIHCTAKQRKISEQARRRLQVEVTGMASCATMNLTQLRRVRAALYETRAPLSLVASSRDASVPRMRRKITALLARLGKPQEYAEGSAKRMYRKPVAECAALELRAVITALTKHAGREQQR